MGKASGMKLCDTCTYGDKTEYFKPCIIYRDDCEYYEKERDDMTDDLISRQAVHYYIEAHINEIITESGVDKNEHTNRMLRTLLNGIDTMPSATPTERTGHWIKVTNGRGGHECDICHEYAPSYQDGDEYLTKYCPNCGAKMV